MNSKIANADSVNKNISATDMYEYKYNVRFPFSNRGEFTPDRNVLVQKDSALLDAICFRPDPKAKVVNLKWELYARNIYSSGILEFQIKI